MRPGSALLIVRLEVALDKELAAPVQGRGRNATLGVQLGQGALEGLIRTLLHEDNRDFQLFRGEKGSSKKTRI